MRESKRIGLDDTRGFHDSRKIPRYVPPSHRGLNIYRCISTRVKSYQISPFGRRLPNTRPMPVRHAARARISGTARHGRITRATYMQLMLWFETRSIPQSRLEQADQDLRAAPALSSEFSAHLPGSGPGVCESEKTTRERRARACAGRFAPHAPGRQISNASAKIIVAAGLSKIEV